MTIFLVFSGLLIVAWVLHVIVWRLRPPRNHTIGLLRLFVLVLAAGLVGSRVALDMGWMQLAHGGLLYVATMLAYIAFYCAIEEDSPSLRIIEALNAEDGTSVSHADLRLLISHDGFVGTRINLMRDTGLLVERDGYLNLTDKGRRFVALFDLPARILGIAKGG